MAQRRPITSHPAFVPLVATWFAALFGLGVAVLPGPLLSHALAPLGMASPGPGLSFARVVASFVAAVIGAAVGLAVGAALSRRYRGDPRPVYAEPDPVSERSASLQAARRPLRVREELGEGELAPHEHGAIAASDAPRPLTGDPRSVGERDGGFMILTPQPVHPPRPLADLEALLEQFDNAVGHFPSGREPRQEDGEVSGDPVQAFVARQTGQPVLSPLGGRVPDHQAELRAALNKLAAMKRDD